MDVRDFTTSWSDGLALNALLHRWRPQLFDYAAVLRRAPTARLEHAFALAHSHLGIPRLLDPEGRWVSTGGGRRGRNRNERRAKLVDRRPHAAAG